MPNHELPKEAIKLMADLSTSHMDAGDNELCSRYAETRENTEPTDLPRIAKHAYGYLVFVSSGDPDILRQQIAAMREHGFSDAFIDIYDRAASSASEITVINFDRDGPIMQHDEELGEDSDPLPVFNW